MTDYTVSSGVVSSGIVLSNSDYEYVSSGGITIGTIVAQRHRDQ